MINNLSSKQILLIVVLGVVILYVIYYFIKNKDNYDMTMSVTKNMNYKKFPLVIYNFYSPNCGYSMQFMPTWKQLEKELADQKWIKVVAVDCTKSENDNLAFYYNIDAYPTVIFTSPKGVSRYSGDRTLENLKKFIVVETMNAYN